MWMTHALDSQMEDNLLQQIYFLGQEMASALQNDDLEGYFELLGKRGTLLVELNEYQHPSEIDPNWQETTDALKAQHDVLMEAVSERERRMQEELTGMQRYKGATRSYQRPDQRSQILNENLRV